jgi:hypothetical protein
MGYGAFAAVGRGATPATVHSHKDARPLGRGPRRTPGRRLGKACWWQRLASSNLASSAAMTWQNVVGA